MVDTGADVSIVRSDIWFEAGGGELEDKYGLSMLQGNQ